MAEAAGDKQQQQQQQQAALHPAVRLVLTVERFEEDGVCENADRQDAIGCVRNREWSVSVIQEISSNDQKKKTLHSLQEQRHLCRPCAQWFAINNIK